MVEIVENSVDEALTAAFANYFSACQRRIPAFIDQHFKYPGTWHTNKHALGWDLLRAPCNLFWAPIYLSLQLLAFLLAKIGLKFLATILRRTPSGLTTDIQRYLSAQTYTQLLGRRFDASHEDELFLTIQQALRLPTNVGADTQQLSASINAIIDDALEQYRITRTASADIGNSLLSSIVGGFAFQKFTPGGIAVGLAIAVWLSHTLAIKNFVLGQWLGGFYYTLFPPSPSLGLSLASVAFVLTCLAIIASFSGLITDPIQSWIGLHKKRLTKMINTLEQDFKRQRAGGFRPKDQFIARILEVIDAAKAPLF